jgi:anti-sigma factor RsiW
MTAQPEMSCRELVDLVTEYLEGALDADTHARFEAHLEMCEGCVAYLEQMRSTVRVLGALPEESLMPLVRDRLLEVFRGWGGTRS